MTTILLSNELDNFVFLRCTIPRVVDPLPPSQISRLLLMLNNRRVDIFVNTHEMDSCTRVYLLILFDDTFKTRSVDPLPKIYESILNSCHTFYIPYFVNLFTYNSLLIFLVFEQMLIP